MTREEEAQAVALHHQRKDLNRRLKNLAALQDRQCRYVPDPEADRWLSEQRRQLEDQRRELKRQEVRGEHPAA